MRNETIDNNYPDKDTIRKDIRIGLANKKNLPKKNESEEQKVEEVTPISEKIQHTLTTFNQKFREAGGKYIPCTNQDLVKTLVAICSSQQLGTLLNTSPNLGVYLNKYQVPFINAVKPNETVDAALFFSDMLVARTGAIGFTQTASLYPSVKNLAKNLIVVSREKCIFQDMEDALAYQTERDKNTGNSTVEFLTPNKPELNEDGQACHTCMNPRIIIMMVEDISSKPAQPVNQPQTPPQNEPEDQEPAN